MIQHCWFISKNAKKFKMSFNGDPNMFSGKIISCTCDMHLKLDILNLLNIFFLPNSFLNEFFCLVSLACKISKFLYDLVSHQVHAGPKDNIRSQKGR
jgi:hypothetical protein